MIELRWLRIHQNDNDGSHPTAIKDAMPGYIRILQFRVLKGPQGEQWWSDWKDIPAVDV